MPNFTATGTNKFDFWQVDGSIDFGHIPANIQFDGSGDPIRLHIGNVHFGAEHIMKHETKWPQHLREKLPAELVFLKLNTPGAIWTAEVDHKKKLMLSLRPSALMVLEHRYIHKDGGIQEYYWSITTMYPFSGRLDGEQVGRYSPTKKQPSADTKNDVEAIQKLDPLAE